MSAAVLAYRGRLIENVHRVSLAIVNPQGQLLAYAGQPGLTTFLRSSAKPFQSQALFLSGAVTRYGLGPRELALASASHHGEAIHVEGVAQFLERLGLGPESLACGVHPPLAEESRKELEARGEAPSPLHHNCSGKHAGMLAAALALGAPLEGYERPEHPVQQLNLTTLRELSRLNEVAVAIDGCSVPTFALPLTRGAWLFAQLAAPENAPAQYQEGLEKVYQAMREYPQLVGGSRSLDTLLMEHLPLVAKGGADGYQGLALRESPWGPVGVALKVEDGSSPAREPIVLTLLERLGLLAAATWPERRRPARTNYRGLTVGHLEAHLELELA